MRLIFIQINEIIKRISPNVELIIILLVGFGVPIYFSTYSFLIISAHQNNSWIYKLTSQGFSFTLLFEIIALMVILYILKLRGWILSDFNLNFSPRLVIVALFLVIIRNIFRNIFYKIFEFFDILSNIPTKHIHYSLEPNWSIFLILLVIDSFYEEFILVGYLFKKLEMFHPVIAIGLSLILRQSYHLYQGLDSMLIIIPTGLIYGYYYFKSKKLLPIVFAHGINNLLVFVMMNFDHT